MLERIKMPIFASLNPDISGGGQLPLTKFGTLVEPAKIHFCARAKRDRAHYFGAINDEPMHEKRKMAIFASLNSISQVGVNRPNPNLARR